MQSMAPSPGSFEQYAQRTKETKRKAYYTKSWNEDNGFIELYIIYKCFCRGRIYSCRLLRSFFRVGAEKIYTCKEKVIKFPIAKKFFHTVKWVSGGS